MGKGEKGFRRGDTLKLDVLYSDTWPLPSGPLLVARLSPLSLVCITTGIPPLSPMASTRSSLVVRIPNQFNTTAPLPGESHLFLA